MNHCHLHSEKITDVQCETCGQYICDECMVEYKQKILCESCKEKASPGFWSILIDRILDAIT